MRGLPNILLFSLFLLFSAALSAQEWRTEPMTPNDRSYMTEQHKSIDELARRHFGRQLNGNKDNDIPVLQRLLDDKIVTASQVRQLQAMGIILGQLLKTEKGLRWVIYVDRYGRSRALQVVGVDKEFIFPATQISRKAEVGIKVNVSEVYKELEQAVIGIRNKPPF